METISYAEFDKRETRARRLKLGALLALCITAPVGVMLALAAEHGPATNAAACQACRKSCAPFYAVHPPLGPNKPFQCFCILPPDDKPLPNLTPDTMKGINL